MSDEVGFFLPRHIERGAVALVERFVLRAYRIDADAVLLHGLDEFHKIERVVVVAVGIEMAVGPVIVGLPRFQTFHLHPPRACPRRGDYLEAGIDGDDLTEHWYHIAELVAVQREMLQARLVAETVLGAREVAAADGDAGVTDTVAVGRGIGAAEEGLAVRRAHAKQVVATAVGDGEAEAVHRLVSLRRVEDEGLRRRDAALPEPDRALSKPLSAVGRRGEGRYLARRGL